MTLFGLKGKNLKEIKHTPFKLEKDIQSLTENNLESIFGLEFVKSEFAIKNYRVDSLSFDHNSKAFVIIEYKRDRSFSVVDQGYTYLSLMLNNKADFILEYNEQSGNTLTKKSVDWSQSKVFFISQSFTSYQKEAINFKDLPIELWEVKKYANDTIMYINIKPQGATESVKTISKSGTTIAKVAKQVKTYDIDEHLKKGTDEIQKAFLKIREEIFNIDSSIIEKPLKSMVSYYSGGKGLVWVQINKKNLRFHLRKGNYKDALNMIKPDGWGGYPELHLKQRDLGLEYLRYLRDILKQAYNY